MSDDILFAAERKAKIVEYINKNKKATVGELCDYFSVSSATIRNDLRDLEQTGRVLRAHGGAMVRTKTGFELDSREKIVHNSAEKQKIAAAALNLVEDGDTIILDTGTTTIELAKLMDQRSDITVITNDLLIALVLEEHESVNTIVLGGTLRSNFHCTIGAEGASLLSRLSVDKAFMAANSFSIEKGATTPDLGHAETKASMIARAGKVILLADSSKFGRNSFAQFASVEQIDMIVTDSAGSKLLTELEQTGIEVVV
jgi:DeoR family transcriptional regulator, fructose operon transcriptional repressor